MGRDGVTVKDLRELRLVVCRPGLTILAWKLAVKEFAVEHGLLDREAVDLAAIAKECF